MTFATLYFELCNVESRLLNRYLWVNALGRKSLFKGQLLHLWNHKYPVSTKTYPAFAGFHIIAACKLLGYKYYTRLV